MKYRRFHKKKQVTKTETKKIFWINHLNLMSQNLNKELYVKFRFKILIRLLFIIISIQSNKFTNFDLDLL